MCSRDPTRVVVGFSFSSHPVSESLLIEVSFPPMCMEVMARVNPSPLYECEYANVLSLMSVEKLNCSGTEIVAVDIES